jgi:hypothetical protein
MTFVSGGRSIKAVHRFDPDAPVLYGGVLSCFSLSGDIYSITFQTGYDSIITITTREWDVRLS